MQPKLTISIVSHLQANLVQDLLSDISMFCDESAIEVILTLNLPESLSFDRGAYGFPVKVLNNPRPMGFSANHNQAFESATGEYFCVLNPDVRLSMDPFPGLSALLNDKKTGIAAPVVVDATGKPEDSMRSFPTPLEIIGKLFGKSSAIHSSDSYSVVFPDWVAGMFMLFRHDQFCDIGGFDASYFLYYEDVDICARLRLEGLRVAVNRDVSIIHEAQRSSHRSLQYLWRHISSILRFFSSPVYRKLRRQLQC